MARMDTRMPLMVQQPDFVNALARSSQAAAQTNAVQDQNALRQLYQTQGADIAAGKPGAINALAGLDPMAALGVQDARQGMAARAEMMEQRRVAAKRQTAEYAATLDAREQAELAKRMETGIARGIGMYQAGDLPGLNELLVGIGEEPIQSLDEFPAIAALYGDSLGKLKEVMAINAPPKPLSSAGKTQADINAGLLPEGTPLTGSGTTVNVDTGGGSKLYETLDKKQGEMFAALIEQGTQVPQNLAMVDEMESILADQNTPEGIAAALQYTAGQFGIPSEGLDALQAAQAIINRLVPAQRQPGSGPMSDADLALFKQSLPQLINTRQGNLIIARTLRGLAQYQQGQAEIAAAVANREIDPAEARKALAELENPLRAFRRQAAGEPVSIGGYKIRKLD